MSDAQESAVSAVKAPEVIPTPQTVAQLQAQIAALKAKAALEVSSASAAVAGAAAEVATATAKVAKQVAKKVKAKVAKKSAKNGKKAAKKEKKEAKSDGAVCTFDDCGRKPIAKGLCPSHYRQQIRGGELKALRPLRGLVRLPMVIRVEQETFDTLEKRVKSGQANSMYDATRQALEAGIATWK